MLDALARRSGACSEGSANEKNYNITKEPIYRYFTGAQTTENEREYFENAVPGYSDPFTNRQKWAAGALEGMLQRRAHEHRNRARPYHDVSAYMDQYQQLSAELQKLKGRAPRRSRKTDMAHTRTVAKRRHRKHRRGGLAEAQNGLPASRKRPSTWSWRVRTRLSTRCRSGRPTTP